MLNWFGRVDLEMRPSNKLISNFGVDPGSDRARRAVALVRDHCRWEHAGQPFFSGEALRNPLPLGAAVRNTHRYEQSAGRTS